MGRLKAQPVARATVLAAALAAAFSVAAPPAGARVQTAAPRDTTAPTATISWPIDGSTFKEGMTVPVAYRCSDETHGSGIASCTGSAVEIADVTPGQHVITARAVDKAGNETTAISSYTVVPYVPYVGRQQELFRYQEDLTALQSAPLPYDGHYWAYQAWVSSMWVAGCCSGPAGEMAPEYAYSVMQYLRTTVLRLVFANKALRDATLPQQTEGVALISAIAHERLAQVTAAQGVNEAKWRAFGPTAPLWAARHDIEHADADKNRVAATLAYIRAWQRLVDLDPQIGPIV